MVADIGRYAADEAMRVVASEGQDLGSRGTQGSLAVAGHSLETTQVEGVVIEAKIPLQTMGPLPSLGSKADAPSSSLNTLAVASQLPDIGAPGPSLSDAELDEELQHLLAPLHLGGEEADDSIVVDMDFSFMESMAAGVKEIQAWHRQNWQELKARRESTDKVDQRMKGKCLELHEWHDKQFKVLMRQQETLQMMREDVMARERRLADHKASLDAREQEISLREENKPPSVPRTRVWRPWCNSAPKN